MQLFLKLEGNCGVNLIYNETYSDEHSAFSTAVLPLDLFSFGFTVGSSVTWGTFLCLVPLTSQLKQPPTLLPMLWLGFGTIPSTRIWTCTFGFAAFPWAALTLSLLSDQTTEKKFLGLFGCGGSMALYWIICHWSRLKQNCTSAPVCWMTLSHNFWKISGWSRVTSQGNSLTFTLTIFTVCEILLYSHNHNSNYFGVW